MNFLQRKRLSIPAIVLMIIIMLFIDADRSDQARAQESTRVYFNPSTAEVYLGNTTQVDLKIGNGANINAFEIELKYDPTVIQLDSWSEGGYLSNLAYFVREEEPGRLHLAAAQLARPGVSGDGILLSMVFSSVSVGTSELILEQSDLALSSGGMLQPAVENGWVDVVTQPAPSATPTLTTVRTGTSTPKPAVTFTMVKTPVPTNTASLPVTPASNLSTAVTTGTLQASRPGVTVTAAPQVTTVKPFATQVTSSSPQPPDGSAQLTATAFVSLSVNLNLTAAPEGDGQLTEKASAAINTLLWIILIALAILFVVLLFRFVFCKRKV